VAYHHTVDSGIRECRSILRRVAKLTPLIFGDAAELLLTKSSFGQVWLSMSLRAVTAAQSEQWIIAYSPV
jgi:hypothetical protein